MSELKVSKLTNRAGTGAPDFSQGVKISGTASTLLAPTRTESATEPTSPANGDTWYDTDNDTYDVYINDEWKRFIGASSGASRTDFTLTLTNFSSDSVSQTGFPSAFTGGVIDPTGLLMFLIDYSSDSIKLWNLSTANDITTATSTTTSVSVSAQDNVGQGLYINDDGTEMYHVGNADSVHRYTMSTAWDLSTASYVSSWNMTTNSSGISEGSYSGVAFNTDGTKMFACGYSQDKMYEFSLSTAWDITTASHTTGSDLTAPSNTPYNFFFNVSGTELYWMDGGDDKLHRYELSTAWDLSTASKQSDTYYVAGMGRGILTMDGTKFITTSSGTFSVHSTGL